MKPRVREEVGRVTPCAPSSQRKQTFAPGNVRSACRGLPALPTLRRAMSSRHRFRLFPQNHQLPAAQRQNRICATFAIRRSQSANHKPLKSSGDFADSLASLRLPKRIRLKSHIRLSGVVVKASSRKQPFTVAPHCPPTAAISRHALKCVAAFCFARHCFSHRPVGGFKHQEQFSHRRPTGPWLQRFTCGRPFVLLQRKWISAPRCCW
jgi:hypothetical protein